MARHLQAKMNSFVNDTLDVFKILEKKNLCFCNQYRNEIHDRPLVKSLYKKNDFLISQPKHMLLRRSF